MGRRASTLPGAVEALLGEPEGSAPDDEPEMAEWLAGIGLIRVPAADPAGFRMAGRFLARFPAEVERHLGARGCPRGSAGLVDPFDPASPERAAIEATLVPLEADALRAERA